MTEANGILSCWLCARALGERVEWHHTVPKARGGRATVPVHPICHRTIHANFTNGELGRLGGQHAALLDNPVISSFVRWIANKPPDFHAPTRKGR